jgi:hypothetical protein
MIYQKKKEELLRKDLFENPSSEYRGTPFWAWNCKVTREQIDFQTEALQKMGMGGAHIHCRTGMNIPYMSEEFLDKVAYAHDRFQEKGMLTWLYDEDRWPSGYGGGFVTKEPEFRMRFLVFSPEEIPEGMPDERGKDISAAVIIRSEKRKLLKRYAVRLNPEGLMEDYRVLKEGEKPLCGYEPWYVYREISGDNIWFNNQAYVNTLDPEAIARFLEVTHEKYYEKLGQYFGKDIPAIFTDEPQFAHKTRLGRAHERKVQFLPYTDDFETTYEKAYHQSFLDYLPEVFWERVENPVSKTRYQYHDHIAERFACAYADQVGHWCQEHGIALTGHMMEEPTLKSQTAALGEAMRSYRSFHVPGIDMLCDSRELTTAKQAQSAVHQYGREGMASEIYGVTNWDFDFRGHKLAGDWQAALGVTVRVHHLTWVSMEGEAKRDYPACIGYQSPWYEEYKLIEDYFSRVNTALVRGNPLVRIGVIHPIESYWLMWGSEETTHAVRETMEKKFDDLIKWLLYETLDFDYISESLLEDLPEDIPENVSGCMQENGLEGIPENAAEGMMEKIPGFCAGQMRYDVIIVPDCITLRANTAERLEAFAKRGGKIIFMGDIPEYVAAQQSDSIIRLSERCEKIPFEKQALIQRLEPYRTLSVRDKSGIAAENLIYQMREDGENRWIFIAHSEKPEKQDTTLAAAYTISVPGIWKVEKYDALSGEIQEIPVHYDEKQQKTWWEETAYAYDSYLYCLKPGKSDVKQTKTRCVAVEQEIDIPGTVQVTLDEPNVLLLDMAEFRLDKGAWHGTEEILRLDNIVREELGYPKRAEAYAQPWIYGEQEYEHRLDLLFQVMSEVELEEVSLALENMEITEVYWNGKKVDAKAEGYYVDQQIKKITLGRVSAGRNILEVHIPYHAKVNVEAMYLLGSFGVKVNGYSAVLTDPVRELSFGDICTQGLPFYGGSLTYHIPVETETDGTLLVQVTKFRNPLLEVTIDGAESRKLFKSPYTVKFENVNGGVHILSVKAFGNRRNTFGQLHNCSEQSTWCSPDAWRTTGENWAYEYQLTKTGILVSPRVQVRREENA